MSELRLNTVTDKDTDKGVNVDALHYQNTQLVRNLGDWQPGLVFENKTDYATHDNQAFVLKEDTTLPYTTQGSDPTVAPDASNVVTFATEVAEWINCFAASYVSPTSFKAPGNQTDSYLPARKVRVDNNAPEYSYTTIVSSVYASGETSVVVSEPVITTGINSVCTSVVSEESSFNKKDLAALTDFVFENVDSMLSGETTGGVEIEHKLGYQYSTGGTTWKMISKSDPVVIGDFESLTAINVKDFGAVGDGVTDDSDAFKRACAASDNVLIPYGRFLYDSDVPIIAREGLTIYGYGKRISRVIMGSSSKGGYGFISNPNNVTEVSLENFGLYGTNTDREERDDATDTFPHNLIELSNCDDVHINNLYVKGWWAYYNYGSGKTPSVIAINDISGANVSNCTFDTCGNEIIVAKNNKESVFDNLLFKAPRASGQQRIYTALHVIADNDQGQQNTVKNCRLTNITVRGSHGSAVNYTGSNSIITNHVYTDCRKGFDINAEQFDVPVTDVMYGNVIDNILFDASPETESYGFRVETNTETDDISISNVTVRNTQHSGFTIAHCRRPTVNNITVINNSGTSKAFRVSSDKTPGSVPTRATISNVKVYDTSGVVSSGFIRGYDALTLTGSSFENTVMELNDITNLTMGDCSYTGYSNIGMYIAGDLDVISIHDTTFRGTAGLDREHISIKSDASYLGLTGVYFSDTTFNYNIRAKSVPEGVVGNNRYRGELVLPTGGFNLSSAVGIGSGTHGWRQPIQLVNGFLFIDSTGKLRIVSSQPTSDTDGTVVGTQT